jgi:hypothetical protein
MASITVNALCACKAFEYRIQYPQSSLPIDRALCICNRCRKNSGSCGQSHIPLPLDHIIDLSKYNLTKYAITENHDRYFCSTCGAHVLTHVKAAKRWSITTGVLETTEGIVNLTGCKYIEGSLDGGISIWLKDIADKDGTLKPLKRWAAQDDEPPIEDDILTHLSSAKPEVSADARLTAACHCGGVKFSITRPNEDSKAASSPFPDLIYPFHEKKEANPNNETWWLRANDKKYLAGLCACPSCRFNSGYEVQPWVFIPKCNLLKEDSTPLDFNIGTLKRYSSSEGVMREFCSVCGATVFWHNDERPTVIDVSVGLLDPEEGARAEGWLEWWTERVSFQELAVSTSLIASLERGLRIWGNGTKG